MKSLYRNFDCRKVMHTWTVVLAPSRTNTIWLSNQWGEETEKENGWWSEE